LPVLDGLRAISILLVLAGHMLPLGGPNYLNASAATMGMSLFFALSGFLIAAGLLHNPSVPEFMVKRLTRIVPLAYGYAFLVFMFIDFSPKEFLWTASFVLNYFDVHMNNYNAHFWSLCVEVQFYLTIAAIVLCAGPKGILVVWPACFLITILRIDNGAYTHIQTHLRGDEILIGSCLATLHHNGWLHRRRYATLLMAGGAGLWLASSSPFSEWLQYTRPYATAFMMGSALCLSDTPIARILASRALRYIAEISYALYVIHPLTVQGWWNTGTVLQRYAFKRPISLVMTFFGAHISTFYWERPWIQAGRQWIRNRRMRQLKSTSAVASALDPQ
jgi:peptidoglycan/LPS O-acetylase OafA/YrhL